MTVGAQPRMHWGWLLRSPLLLAACAAALVACVVLTRALGSLALAAELRHELQRAAARIAAEHAAARAVERPQATVELDAGGGIRARATARRVEQSIELVATAGPVHERFVCAALPGGALPLFGSALVAPADLDALPPGWPEPERLPAPELPRLPSDGFRGEAPPTSPLLARDRGIALLRLPAGTDREDWVLGRTPGGGAPRLPGGVLHVDGNLWIDRGDVPLELELAADVTIAVRGNLYLGRSLLLSGPGRLTLATTPVGGELRPMEGSGNVHFGLPGGQPASELQCDATIVVGRELFVAAERLVLRGSLVLGSGVTVANGCRGALDVSTWVPPDLGRSAVPGFPLVGGPRPGRLRSNNDALYLAAPSR